MRFHSGTVFFIKKKLNSFFPYSLDHPSYQLWFNYQNQKVNLPYLSMTARFCHSNPCLRVTLASITTRGFFFFFESQCLKSVGWDLSHTCLISVFLRPECVILFSWQMFIYILYNMQRLLCKIQSNTLSKIFKVAFMRNNDSSPPL